jgi:uncharacterized protein YgiM (DUF1202 family)
MFKYLLLFSATFYLALLIGGQDNGQQRMGLRGAYDIALAPQPAPVTPAVQATETTAAAQAPADTLRILPSVEAAPTVQPASLTSEPALEPALNTFNNPTLTLRTITAEAANVRDAASRTGNVIGRLENGEIVQVLETSGDWVHIRIEGDGIDGFVHRRLISTEAPGLTTTTLFPAVD